MSKQKKIEKQLVGESISNVPNTDRIVVAGIAIIVAFILFFGVWAIFSPLESAAIAQGKVIVAGKRRMIQHFEGGIVEKIYVKDGTLVSKGQPLLQIEDTQSKVSLELVQNEFFELALIEARLQAEYNQEKQLKFPKILSRYADNEKAKSIYANQVKIFFANKKSFEDKISILQRRREQLVEEQRGEEAQLKSLAGQQKLILDELKDIEILYKKKLVNRTRYLNLLREKERLAGRYGEKVARIATVKQKIAELDQETIALVGDMKKDILNDLREARQKLRDAIEKEKAARDVHYRTTIKSPITGTVVGLKVHTIGQVVKAGETIMEIVPKHERLVIEAEVKPVDIDVVKVGLMAKVQLTAFQSRSTPALIGHVTHVSADSFTNEKTGETYYSVTIEINADELKRLGKQTLQPGMPAEVMIITDKLTPWGYFIGPIKRSFHRAFREQ